MATPEQEFIVSGLIHLPNGAPAENALVSAFDRGMRSEQLLGEILSESNGAYTIPFTSSRFRRAEK